MSTTSTPCPEPFVGLRPFDIGDAYWFCGREREAAALIQKVHASRFTAVVGPSGSGKSSLVRAGVLSPLTADGWPKVIVRPGSAPIARLAAALAAAASQPQDRLAEACRVHFDATLRASAYGLAEIAETLVPKERHLVLLVDQFEELFRYGDDAGAAAAAAMREEGRAYVELLLTAAARRAAGLHIVLTMRSDYFGNCSAYQGLAEEVSAGQYLVPLPERDQLEIAIREPVAKARANIEDGLVQRLLVDVEEQTDQLPLFQHTLRRLWEAAQGEPRTLRERDYVDVGQLAGSIDKKAEAIYTHLAETHPSDKVTLERVMKALTDLDEHDRATRRPQKTSELVALLADASDDRYAAEQSLNRVLKALRAEGANFLHISDEMDPDVDISDNTDPDVDIGHEALIRSWRRLAGPELNFKSGWLREEREDGERWRENVRRANEGWPLTIRGQLRLGRWLRRKGFGSAWSMRYGDSWDAVGDLRRRSFRLSLSFAIGVIGLLAAFAAYQLWPENTYRSMVAGLERGAADAFDAAGIWLLDNPGDRELRDNLTENEPNLPRGYGIAPLKSFYSPAKFVLTHSPDRRLDWEYFHRIWRPMAQSLATSWGIPVPMAFHLETDKTLKLQEVEITAPTGESAALWIPAHEQYAAIDPRGLSGAAQQFMKSISDEWWPMPIMLPLMDPQKGPPWLLVPRWSLPIWKHDTPPALDGSEVTAILVADQLLEHLEVLLTPQTVQLLLDRVAKNHPDTVAEARRARGEQLPKDLTEFVKLRQSLTTLPIILDALAQFPRQGSTAKASPVHELWQDSGRSKLATVAQDPIPAEVVAQAIEVMGAQHAALPRRLHGRWTNSDIVRDEPLPKSAEAEDAFRQVEPWLAAPQPLIGVHSLSAEYVSWLLSKVSPELETWLTDHYSLTDLKLLLRGIVDPAASDAAPQRTLWHTEWLLGSLVFWAQTASHLDPISMVVRLRKTEMARLKDKPPAQIADQFQVVDMGVRALSEGRVEDAEKLFDKAGQDEATTEAFLALYSGAPEVLRRNLEDPEGAANLAYVAIEEYDPLSTDPRSLALAQQLLESALRQLDEQQAHDTFRKVIEVCAAEGPKAWCWDFADRLARAVPKGDIPLELAYQLSSFEPKRYLERALAHADQAEENLRSSISSDEDRAWKEDFLAYSRATAYTNLALLGDNQRWQAAEELLRDILNSSAVGLMANDQLVKLLIGQGRFRDAEVVLDSARERWPNEHAFLVDQLRLELTQGDSEGVAITVHELADKAVDNDDAMFSASIGELLLPDSPKALTREFINKTETDYVADYGALLLYAFENRDRQYALQVLQGRWRPSLKGTWPNRLAQGDSRVWREMLIGYYLGQIPREDLLAPLVDEETFKTSTFSSLPLSRQGMLCEFFFYDAMLAKTRGDLKGMFRGLQAVVDTGYKPYYEYQIAKFLLKSEAPTPG